MVRASKRLFVNKNTIKGGATFFVEIGEGCVPGGGFVEPGSHFGTYQPNGNIHKFIRTFFSLCFFFCRRTILSTYPYSFFSGSRRKNCHFIVTRSRPLTNRNGANGITTLMSTNFYCGRGFDNQGTTTRMNFRLPTTRGSEIFCFVIEVYVHPQIRSVFHVVFYREFSGVLCKFICRLFFRFRGNAIGGFFLGNGPIVWEPFFRAKRISF